ncbi:MULTISPECIES: hypothetical protein [Azorhizobium]|uniref:hypothetical protein n=1 Tax=Azorhizobium TaxID=6 RepID=UPI0010F40997|nr:hypothetical protein [Azorhizobium sp. AG788]TDT87717.1 hypothetical protein DFO45_4934 [Azorhizobium sp. AG788]
MSKGFALAAVVLMSVVGFSYLSDMQGERQTTGIVPESASVRTDPPPTVPPSHERR